MTGITFGKQVELFCSCSAARAVICTTECIRSDQVEKPIQCASG